MNHRILAFGLAFSAFSASTAFGLTQPDGTVIPTTPSLQDLFNSRGEGISALNDANIVPETFVPSCALTFTVLQRDSAYNNSFGWYNVTGSPPTIADLHEFLACTDPVGTVKVLDIKNDPAYLGGEIAFYQATGPCGSLPMNYLNIFYSQKAYNPDSGQANPFIHLLIYNSTVTQKAFYFCWEDLISGGDNDFNDFTSIVTGISCSGGGGACQTGQLGICADGTLQCQSGVLTCLQNNAQSSEVCDGLDNDCNGLDDDGDICQANEVCDKGTCVPKCGGGEFICPGEQVCNAAGYCVDPACENVTCPSGQKCIAGVCKGPCDGVVCPYGQVCRVGACVDPCSAIVCDPEQVCVLGACKDKCQCSGCAATETCEPNGVCISTTCVGVNCPAGSHCALDGTCVDDCMGAICPTGQVCVSGLCIDSGSSSTGTGMGGGNFVGSGGAAGMSSGAANGGAGGAGSASGDTGGCGCRVGDTTTAAGTSALALLGLLGVMRRRRQRAKSR